MTTMQDARHVISEEGLRSLLAQGYLVEVQCSTTPTRTSAQWSGVWTASAVSPDGSTTLPLVTSRNASAPRQFKTINGLVSFLAGLELSPVKIPMQEGQSTEHALADHS